MFFLLVINNYLGRILLNNLSPPIMMIPKDNGIHETDVTHSQLQDEKGATSASLSRSSMI
jgi:hypothetical protein